MMNRLNRKTKDKGALSLLFLWNDCPLFWIASQLWKTVRLIHSTVVRVYVSLSYSFWLSAPLGPFASWHRVTDAYKKPAGRPHEVVLKPNMASGRQHVTCFGGGRKNNWTYQSSPKKKFLFSSVFFSPSPFYFHLLLLLLSQFVFFFKRNWATK